MVQEVVFYKLDNLREKYLRAYFPELSQDFTVDKITNMADHDALLKAYACYFVAYSILDF